MSSIEVKNLSFCYRPEETLLKDISFEVKPGAFLAIVGPNGAGKTTLLNLLCAVLKPQTGSIKIDSALIESYSIRKLAQRNEDMADPLEKTIQRLIAAPRLRPFKERALPGD